MHEVHADSVYNGFKVSENATRMGFTKLGIDGRPHRRLLGKRRLAAECSVAGATLPTGRSVRLPCLQHGNVGDRDLVPLQLALDASERLGDIGVRRRHVPEAGREDR